MNADSSLKYKTGAVAVEYDSQSCKDHWPMRLQPSSDALLGYRQPLAKVVKAVVGPYSCTPAGLVVPLSS